MIIFPTSRDLIDITSYILRAAESDNCDTSGRRIHREVRQKLRHEVQLAAEILRADRAGRVDQKYQFYLTSFKQIIQTDSSSIRSKIIRKLDD